MAVFVVIPAEDVLWLRLAPSEEVAIALRAIGAYIVICPQRTAWQAEIHKSVSLRMPFPISFYSFFD